MKTLLPFKIAWLRLTFRKNPLDFYQENSEQCVKSSKEEFQKRWLPTIWSDLESHLYSQFLGAEPLTDKIWTLPDKIWFKLFQSSLLFIGFYLFLFARKLLKIPNLLSQGKNNKWLLPSKDMIKKPNLLIRTVKICLNVCFFSIDS